MHRAAWWVLAAALAGCVTSPVTPPPMSLDPALLQSWSASGRMAIAANDEGGSGSFTWDQRDADSTLSLRGPLGAGAMQVTTDGRTLAVTDGEGRQFGNDQAQGLLRQRLGVELPLAELRYWMLGVASPDGPASVQDAAEAPRRIIEQAGWRIAYDAFQTASGLSVPQRFTASQGGVRLKVVVDEWRFVQAAGRGH